MSPVWRPNDDLEVRLRPRREVFAGRTWRELLPLMGAAIVAALLWQMLEWLGGV